MFILRRKKGRYWVSQRVSSLFVIFFICVIVSNESVAFKFGTCNSAFFMNYSNKSTGPENKCFFCNRQCHSGNLMWVRWSHSLSAWNWHLVAFDPLTLFRWFFPPHLTFDTIHLFVLMGHFLSGKFEFVPNLLGAENQTRTKSSFYEVNLDVRRVMTSNSVEQWNLKCKASVLGKGHARFPNSNIFYELVISYYLGTTIFLLPIKSNSFNILSGTRQIGQKRNHLHLMGEGYLGRFSN